MASELRFNMSGAHSLLSWKDNWEELWGDKCAMCLKNFFGLLSWQHC